MKLTHHLRLCLTVLAVSLDPFAALAQGGAGAKGPDPAAVKAGQALFTGKFGCSGCHGSDGKGARGPNLTDNTWIYGGDAESVTETLLKGRPNGMPAVSNATPEEVAQLVGFVRSLSAKP